MTKSTLAPVGSLGDVNQLAGLLGCGTSTLPLKYLGLPLWASFKLKTMWVELEELMTRRLAPWKRSYLSKGGKVTLIKSTLSNLPTYMLSLFPIPAYMAKRIKKIQRDFLWGGLDDEVKMHLVERDKVYSPIDEGGVGIWNVGRFNQALLGKWLWRFAHEEGAWWRSVLVAKYGSVWGGWHSRDISRSHGWVFGNTFVRDGRFLRAILDLILAIALRSTFGMMCGVGIELLQRLFLVCLSLPASRRRPLQTIWSAQMELSNGTSSLVG